MEKTKSKENVCNRKQNLKATLSKVLLSKWRKELFQLNKTKEKFGQRPGVDIFFKYNIQMTYSMWEILNGINNQRNSNKYHNELSLQIC